MVIHRRGLRPSSLGWQPRFVFFDIAWAGMSALLAFWLRNPEAYTVSSLTWDGLQNPLLYAVVSIVCAPPVFAWVGVGEDDPDEYGTVPGADVEIANALRSAGLVGQTPLRSRAA